MSLGLIKVKDLHLLNNFYEHFVFVSINVEINASFEYISSDLLFNTNKILSLLILGSRVNLRVFHQSLLLLKVLIVTQVFHFRLNVKYSTQYSTDRHEEAI